MCGDSFASLRSWGCGEGLDRADVTAERTRKPKRAMCSPPNCLGRVCPPLRKLMDLYSETQVYNRLWRGRPSCGNAACLRWDAVLGAICAWAELSALVFDLPDEVLATCGEGWTAVHVLLVPRMEVITNGPDDCSPFDRCRYLARKTRQVPDFG